MRPKLRWHMQIRRRQGSKSRTGHLPNAIPLSFALFPVNLHFTINEGKKAPKNKQKNNNRGILLRDQCHLVAKSYPVLL